jgi:xylulokinase
MAVIGIDLGTQSLKAIVVDGDLVVRGEQSIAYRPDFPRPGWAEQDSRLWLDALRPAIGGALTQAGMTGGDIASIAVTGQLDGCVPVDASGRALAPAIIWMDRRASQEVKGIDPDLIRSRTGNVLDSTHMAAKIRWSAHHLPAANQVATWHQPVSFIVAALCGHNVMDHSLASTTMLYDLETRCWADDLLAMFEVDSFHLPDIAEATSVAGVLSRQGAELTGLAPGIPVAVGTGDDFAGAIGAGVIAPGVISCTVGTAEVVGAVAAGFHLDHDALVETHRFPSDRYFIENPGWLSGGAVTWFLATFGLDSPAEMSAIAATAKPGSDDLLFLPALSGAMTPRWHSGGRGAFYGLTASHGRAECARAVFEGCAFAMRDVVERIDAMGMASSTIRFSGGGAHSDIWAHIRADVSGKPVEVVRYTDSAPLGAAILAMPAAGMATSLDRCVASVVGISRIIEPDPQRQERYARSYRRYRALFDALSPMFEE